MSPIYFSSYTNSQLYECYTGIDFPQFVLDFFVPLCLLLHPSQLKWVVRFGVCWSEVLIKIVREMVDWERSFSDPQSNNTTLVHCMDAFFSGASCCFLKSNHNSITQVNDYDHKKLMLTMIIIMSDKWQWFQYLYYLYIIIIIFSWSFPQLCPISMSIWCRRRAVVELLLSFLFQCPCCRRRG